MSDNDNINDNDDKMTTIITILSTSPTMHTTQTAITAVISTTIMTMTTTTMMMIMTMFLTAPKTSQSRTSIARCVLCIDHARVCVCLASVFEVETRCCRAIT